MHDRSDGTITIQCDRWDRVRPPSRSLLNRSPMHSPAPPLIGREKAPFWRCGSAHTDGLINSPSVNTSGQLLPGGPFCAPENQTVGTADPVSYQVHKGANNGWPRNDIHRSRRALDPTVWHTNSCRKSRRGHKTGSVWLLRSAFFHSSHTRQSPISAFVLPRTVGVGSSIAVSRIGDASRDGVRDRHRA